MADSRDVILFDSEPEYSLVQMLDRAGIKYTAGNAYNAKGVLKIRDHNPGCNQKAEREDLEITRGLEPRIPSRILAKEEADALTNTSRTSIG